MSTHVATPSIDLLIVTNELPLPRSVEEVCRSDGIRATQVEHACNLEGEDGRVRFDAALVLNTEGAAEQRRRYLNEAEYLYERLGAGHAGVLVMTPNDATDVYDLVDVGPLDRVSPEVSTDELRGRLMTMARYRPLVESLERELVNMQRLGKKLNTHFAEIDQEMRLASRLQRDFLPKELPSVGGISVSTIYRPATWVSGDIYDVCRVDEDHIALYIADAVGHGMAAALLTMFIKRAIVPKRIHQNDYDIVPPGEVIAYLNESLKSQNLPNCQFVTACYCLYNVRTRQLQVARGGHPYPIRIGKDGRLGEIRSTGGLLGLFSGEEFDTVTTTLQPGEKLLLYSDGVEMAFLEKPEQHGNEPRYQAEFQSVAHLPGKDLLARLGQMIDDEEGSLNPGDDVTIIVLQTPE